MRSSIAIWHVSLNARSIAAVCLLQGKNVPHTLRGSCESGYPECFSVWLKEIPVTPFARASGFPLHPRRLIAGHQ